MSAEIEPYVKYVTHVHHMATPNYDIMVGEPQLSTNILIYYLFCTEC